MTPEQIAAECHRLEAKAAAKGYYMPKVTVRLNWLGYELTADIETRTDANARTVNKWVHIDYVDGFDNLFDLTDAYINNLQPIEEAKRDAFIAAVGKLIDQGRDIGIEVDFLNPLTEMMTKLSSNIITKQTDEEVPF